VKSGGCKTSKVWEEKVFPVAVLTPIVPLEAPDGTVKTRLSPPVEMVAVTGVPFRLTCAPKKLLPLTVTGDPATPLEGEKDPITGTPQAMEKKVVLWFRTTPLSTRKSARTDVAAVGVPLTTPVVLLRTSPSGNP
jgi:hypothetical protein